MNAEPDMTGHRRNCSRPQWVSYTGDHGDLMSRCAKCSAFKVDAEHGTFDPAGLPRAEDWPTTPKRVLVGRVCGECAVRPARDQRPAKASMCDPCTADRRRTRDNRNTPTEPTKPPPAYRSHKGNQS